MRFAYSFVLKSLRRRITSFGIERGGDHRDALRELIDEELRLVGVAGGKVFDLRFHRAGLQFVEVEQSERMNLDVGGDDEFLAGKADAVVGDERERKRFLGIADVHHHFGFRTAEAFEVGALHVELKASFIDKTRVALGAGYGDHLAVLQNLRAVFGADDGRHAQFAADDGGVAGAPAAIGDDGGGLFHDRLPVRIGLVGDQNLALLELADELRALDDAHRARGNLLADAASGDEHRPAMLEFVNLDHVHVALRLHSFRPGLEDEQFAGVSVLRPFDVHRRRVPFLGRVVVFDDAGPAGELQDFLVGDRELRAVAGRDRNVLHHLSAADVINEFEFLCANDLLKDRFEPGL